jgi:hypothetical protein
MTDPTTCHICGRHATGIGIGRLPNDPRYLCKECIPLIEYVKDIRRWDAYECKALDDVDEATSDYAAQHGTDIAEYDDATRRGLWQVAIRAHQDGLRRLIKNGDAPW